MLTLAAPMLATFLDQAEYWAYRAGAFMLLNVVDDPAWLAMIFC